MLLFVNFIALFKKIFYIKNIRWSNKGMQLTLFQVEQPEKKRIHNINPVYFKSQKIKKELKEWNTISHIYRYQTLYAIMQKLFILTFNKKLACLNYYIDEERDGSKYYEVMYAGYPPDDSSLKERIQKHIALLRKVYNNDPALEYDKNKKVISDIISLFS